jgi:hypothetical protein
MRVVFDPESQLIWQQYYTTQAKQAGHGLPGFQGVQYQRGNGLGALFKGLFRMIFPIAKTVGKAVGRQALITGTDVVADVLGGRPFEEAVKAQGKAGLKNLVNKAQNHLQSGGGVRKMKKKGKAKTKKRPLGIKKKKLKKPTNSKKKGNKGKKKAKTKAKHKKGVIVTKNLFAKRSKVDFFSR